MAITEAEVLKRVEGLPKKTQRSMVCALVGHSRIVSLFFGQVTCGRCGAIIGDTLSGCFQMANKVVLKHRCSVCKKNYRALGWKDKLLSPDPFAEEK